MGGVPCLPLGTVGAPHRGATHGTTAHCVQWLFTPSMCWVLSCFLGVLGGVHRVWGLLPWVGGVRVRSCPLLAQLHHSPSPCRHMGGAAAPRLGLGLRHFWGYCRDCFPQPPGCGDPFLGFTPPLLSPAPQSHGHTSLSRTPQFSVGPCRGDTATVSAPAPQKHPAPPSSTVSCTHTAKTFSNGAMGFLGAFCRFCFFIFLLASGLGVCIGVCWPKEQAGAAH